MNRRWTDGLALWQRLAVELLFLIEEGAGRLRCALLEKGHNATMEQIVKIPEVQKPVISVETSLVDEDDEPRCETCGVELTTAMMAVFCPRAEQCEFWPMGEPENEMFIRRLREGITDDGLVVIGYGSKETST